MGFLLSNVFGLEKGARFFFYVHYIIQIHFTIFCMPNNHYYIKNIISFNFGSVKNVGVEDTPRISEPLSFFEKTLFSSAPTGVSHR